MKSTFKQITDNQHGLTRNQKAELHNRYIKECKNCKGSECDRCGGSGVRRKCELMHCIEHGCCGDGECEVTAAEITQLLSPKNNQLRK